MVSRIRQVTAMGIFKGETMNTAKNHAGHGISQIKLTNYLLNNLQQFNLKPTTKLVLLYLSGCYNPKHADVFPKQKTIANQMGISEASVIRAIAELHKEGLIVSERKYSNRYKFTAKILDVEQADKMQVENLQNETAETCKMTPTCNRTTIEQESNNGGVDNLDEYKILKSYAVSKNARNVAAYVATLKKNGSAEAIIQQEREKQQIEQYHANKIERTKILIEYYNESKKDVAPPTQSWLELKTVLEQKRQKCVFKGF